MLRAESEYFGANGESERELGGDRLNENNQFVDLCSAHNDTPIVHSSDFVYGKCNFKAFNCTHSSNGSNRCDVKGREKDRDTAAAALFFTTCRIYIAIRIGKIAFSLLL